MQALPPGFSGDVRVELMRSTVEMLGCALAKSSRDLGAGGPRVPRQDRASSRSTGRAGKQGAPAILEIRL